MYAALYLETFNWPQWGARKFLDCVVEKCVSYSLFFETEVLHTSEKYTHYKCTTGWIARVNMAKNQILFFSFLIVNP